MSHAGIKTMNNTKSVARRWLDAVVRHFGYVLLPVREIERMESDAAGNYEVMKRPGISERNAGYFNGLADHGSKTAAKIRERYMPKSRIKDLEAEVTELKRRLSKYELFV